MTTKHNSTQLSIQLGDRRMASSFFLRTLVALGWPFTVYWLFVALMYLWSYPSVSLGYERGLGAVLFLLSFVFGFIFTVPSKILRRLNAGSTIDQQHLIIFVAALVLALLLDMLLRWFIRRACALRTSGSREDWMA